MSWLKGDLILGWMAAEDHPALAEVRFRVVKRLLETWEIVRMFFDFPPNSNQPGANSHIHFYSQFGFTLQRMANTSLRNSRCEQSHVVCGQQANSALVHNLRGTFLIDSFPIVFFLNLHRPDDSWGSPEAHSLPGPNQTSIHSGPEPAVERLVSGFDRSCRWAHNFGAWNMVRSVNTILLLTTTSLTNTLTWSTKRNREWNFPPIEGELSIYHTINQRN